MDFVNVLKPWLSTESATTMHQFYFLIFTSKNNFHLAANEIMRLDVIDFQTHWKGKVLFLWNTNMSFFSYQNICIYAWSTRILKKRLVHDNNYQMVWEGASNIYLMLFALKTNFVPLLLSKINEDTICQVSFITSFGCSMRLKYIIK